VASVTSVAYGAGDEDAGEGMGASVVPSSHTKSNG
jgi:hypothetical protein